MDWSIDGDQWLGWKLGKSPRRVAIPLGGLPLAINKVLDVEHRGRILYGPACPGTCTGNAKWLLFVAIKHSIRHEKWKEESSKKSFIRLGIRQWERSEAGPAKKVSLLSQSIVVPHTKTNPEFERIPCRAFRTSQSESFVWGTIPRKKTDDDSLFCSCGSDVLSATM